ncbi:HopJ type III effector protein [Mucilaginibacter litoreus]|uniref:HopJ type III effector protein n=1 Tax=Mucilaginibacter litoreus TaxID=1048221 RepID=A0ABW3ANM0_9SPHI
MEKQLNDLLKALKANSLAFSDVLTFINTYYEHQPTAFKNGDVYNESTQNQGSARVFAFAQLNNLSAEETLYLFAEHYQSVLAHPDATDHQNIRQFMANGWPGIVFEGTALIPKSQN